MKITIASVGKARKSTEAELAARYLKQTRWNIALKEIPDAPGNLPPAQRKRWEAGKIEALLDNNIHLIALDNSGEQMTSEQFAKLIMTGGKHLLFVIGGQDGLDASLLKKASRVIAFGRVTWPHQLMRALLAEQLYRAYSISIGHPYHSGH